MLNFIAHHLLASGRTIPAAGLFSADVFFASKVEIPFDETNLFSVTVKIDL